MVLAVFGCGTSHHPSPPYSPKLSALRGREVSMSESNTEIFSLELFESH
jgi:hypothetical protein